mmetsp:Transcript_11187/g.18334  ORF Transcript_11187/g.18334 Transcript_11187/m.18334 type:complete len:247 (-) Transcript_11187:1122-1862(-)
MDSQSQRLMTYFCRYLLQKGGISRVQGASQHDLLPDQQSQFIGGFVKIIRLVHAPTPYADHIHVGRRGRFKYVSTILSGHTRREGVDGDKVGPPHVHSYPVHSKVKSSRLDVVECIGSLRLCLSPFIRRARLLICTIDIVINRNRILDEFDSAKSNQLLLLLTASVENFHRVHIRSIVAAGITITLTLAITFFTVSIRIDTALTLTGNSISSNSSSSATSRPPQLQLFNMNGRKCDDLLIHSRSSF